MLIKYGWHGFPALVRMLNEESRVCLYQEYVATGIKILSESYVKCHGADLQLPSFIEMTHKKKYKETAQQIINHVKQIFS